MQRSIPADSRLLNALAESFYRLGAPAMAHEAALGSLEATTSSWERGTGRSGRADGGGGEGGGEGGGAGVRADVPLIRTLLRACIELKADAPLDRVMAVARAHGVPLRSASDLLLRAHISHVPLPSDRRQRDPQRRGEAAESSVATHATAVEDVGEVEARLGAALAIYKDTRRKKWEQSATARRWMLRLCAEHGRVAEALEVLRDMESAGFEPGFEALNALMQACRRCGDIDEETLRLWLGKENTDVIIDRGSVGGAGGSAEDRGLARSVHGARLGGRLED